MQLFISTANQMVYLFALIIIGFILSKIGVLPDGTEKIIAKPENNIFIPALVMGTFITKLGR